MAHRNKWDKIRRLTDAEHIVRIKKFRFERGKEDALAGEPPTEANEEYQAGYKEGLKQNGR